ncbi:unnamed protein product [Urochloa decumbens]|uniref:Uncharacterized protein n=1 Tax=Urochloa decumbens TaxID=240449 RepID=A0ABC9FMD8_9POAL
MLSCHPPSPSSAVTPPSPINIEDEGQHNLEAMLPHSTSPAEVAEPPPAPSELGASTPHASRRRGGRIQAEGSNGHALLPSVELARDTGVGGGGVASGGDFTGNGEGGGAHVAIDVATLQQAAALAGAPTESGTNRALVNVLSTCCRSIDGGSTRYILTVGNADNTGEPKASVMKQKYAKVLLSLYGVCLSACSAAFPVVKQAAPDGYLILAYGLLVVLSLVLLVGLLATTFDGSPSSVVWGKYALQLALGLTIGLLTWSVCSLEPKLDVPIGIAGALAYMAVVLLFHCRKCLRVVGYDGR